MKKNRLPQSGPWRRHYGAGTVIQEQIATRVDLPTATVPTGDPLEVSSGAAFGGTDMRPGLTPVFPGSSAIEVELDCTLVCGATSGPRLIDVVLEVSDDDGATWTEIGSAEPAASLPENVGVGVNNSTRQNIEYRSAAALVDVLPDYLAGTEVIARALLSSQNTSNSYLTSEANPGNCRVALREVLA